MKFTGHNAKQTPSILCVHSGCELYGADRNLIRSVNVFKKCFSEGQINIFLPCKGPLFDTLNAHHSVQVKEIGVLRKRDFRKLDFRAIFRLFTVFFKTRKEVKKYNYIYINTLVIIDYIIASRLSASTNIIHVREIPSGFIRFFFGMILMFFADYVIFNSMATWHAYRFYVNFKKKFIVYNGVKGFSPDAVKVKQCFSEKINLLVIGRINPLKGQSLLLDAIHILPEVYKSKIKLKIAGDVFKDEIQFKEELMQKVIRYQLEDQVEIIPFQQDTLEMYNWSDIVIIPSVRPESFGMVAVEAMSASRPVIAAAHGGLLEIVVHEQTGLLFEPGNIHALSEAITKLISHPELICPYGQEGHKRFQAYFTEEIYNHNFSSLIKEIIG